MRAIWVTASGVSSLSEVDEGGLPEGDVTVRVSHSTLNFKDALAITGRSPIIRTFPMVPGIDFAGTVEKSAHADFPVGTEVVLNGWGVGETRWGGLAQKARVNGDWLVRVPERLGLARTMAIGTAGYTAMLCVLALENHGVTPDKGEILVTGASGGVGGIALQLLAGRGFKVVASTGRLDEREYLNSLGASEVIDRNLLNQPGKPLAKERWAGAVDSVGSHTLANVIAQTRYEGVVTACGLAQGMDLPGTVMPFILRAVSLVGVESVVRPIAQRKIAWQRLSEELDLSKLDLMTKTIPLDDAVAAAPALLDGKIRGRLVVSI